MNLNLDCDIAKEILITSAYINSINIPNDLFYEIVSLAADSKKNVYIDTTKKLEDQNISEESKDWLSFFYYKSTNEENQRILLNAWKSNVHQKN